MWILRFVNTVDISFFVSHLLVFEDLSPYSKRNTLRRGVNSWMTVFVSSYTWESKLPKFSLILIFNMCCIGKFDLSLTTGSQNVMKRSGPTHCLEVMYYFLSSLYYLFRNPKSFWWIKVLATFASFVHRLSWIIYYVPQTIYIYTYINKCIWIYIFNSYIFLESKQVHLVNYICQMK